MKTLIKMVVALAWMTFPFVSLASGINIKSDDVKLNAESGEKTYIGNVILTKERDSAINITADNLHQNDEEVVYTGNVVFSIGASEFNTAKAKVIFNENEMTIRMDKVKEALKL